MPRQRSLFAGGTDYTAVSLDDILHDLATWRDALASDRARHDRWRGRLDSLPRSKHTQEGRQFVAYMDDVLGRLHGEFALLTRELPMGVQTRHPQIVRDMFRLAREADTECVRLKQALHLDAVDDRREEDRLLAEIYAESRDCIVDLFDLSNIAPRLEMLVGSPGAAARPQPTTSFSAAIAKLEHRLRREREQRGTLWLVIAAVVTVVLSALAV